MVSNEHDELNYFHQVVNSDDRIIQAREPVNIRRAFKQGKLAGFPAVEGVHCLGKPGKHAQQQRLDRIDELLINLACAYFTLTHFTRNDAATSAS